MVDRGLNRCAALLSNILENEDKGKSYHWLFIFLAAITENT